MNFAKIVATIGPASEKEEVFSSLVKAGLSVARLNFSHGTHEEHGKRIATIRAVSKKLKKDVAILADLCGPKIRVGELASPRILNAKSVVTFSCANHTETSIPVQYAKLAQEVKKGTTLMLDDGKLSCVVEKTDGAHITARMLVGGELKSRKGINVINGMLSVRAFTDKDKKDVLFAIENGCDYVALSFVRNAKDVQLLQRFLAHHGSSMWICSKIEKPEAVTDLDNIVKASNAIMVARGDLGVEIPAAQVPTVQKRIIALCNTYGKPVITATQMLESMIQNPRPTRAEASDVANAVYDGTDGVMLSAETSVGAYPIDTVAYMRMICSEAERALLRDDARLRRHVQGLPQKEQNTDLIAAAAASIAEDERIHAIATLSLSGETALLISNKRPIAPIIAVTELPNIARRVGLFWGTTGVLMDNVTTTDDTIEELKKMLVKKHYLHSGMQIVVTIGRPLVARSRTNMLSIEKLP